MATTFRIETSPDTRITTAEDIARHLIRYLGSPTAATPDTLIDLRGAIESALRVFGNAHRWSYYYTRWRINFVAPQTSSTISYTHATRAVTLASGTWPTWARNAVIRINN